MRVLERTKSEVSVRRTSDEGDSQCVRLSSAVNLNVEDVHHWGKAVGAVS